MEKVEKKENSSVFSVLYLVGVATLINTTLREHFHISNAIANSIGYTFTLLTSYPLFIRGTRNHWSKVGNKWTFKAWLGVAAIMMIVIFLLSIIIPIIF